MLHEFLKQVHNDRPARFSDNLAEVYSRLIRDLTIEFPNLDQCDYSLDEDSPESVACQFHKLFPAHSLKFYLSLVAAELETLEKSGDTPLVLPGNRENQGGLHFCSSNSSCPLLMSRQAACIRPEAAPHRAIPVSWG